MVLGTLGALLLIVIVYVIYVFASYKRLPDNIVLTPEPTPARYLSMDRQTPEQHIIEPGMSTYTIMTYNIGFGAYTPDYSFFMDGGKYSWARSEEGLKENLISIAHMIEGYDPDFVLLQEVDEDGTRSYHVNEVSYMCALDYYQHVYAQNFDSPFLFWPLLEPHGANKSGLLTLSSAYISSALRRSLPVADSLTKIVDYDRCYSISRIPLGNEVYPYGVTSDSGSTSGAELVIFNVHLSAYSTDAVREAQLSMLFEDMEKEYAKGNYIICGGDFNHNLRSNNEGSQAPGWAQPFPTEEIPYCFSLGFTLPRSRLVTYDRAPTEEEKAQMEKMIQELARLEEQGKWPAKINIEHDSCRNADEPYNPDTTFTVLADGFIVSDNIQVLCYESVDLGYAYSDHDPVIMEFRLLEE
ncbi:MAG: endonuclease/exonuclease/phosphatase family protein [Clostridiales bacterium]|nr:endonuclease/exonuclease/phosphatase family protein [Clostridiales bacterium]